MSATTIVRMNYPEDMRVVVTTSPELDIRIEGRWEPRKRYQLFVRFHDYDTAADWLISRTMKVPWLRVSSRA
jgi:antibiotic biosynthesis monooxygenase (ABM) superfamily enzyme